MAETQEPRNNRKTRVGIVVSNKMQKTVVVRIERRVQHPLYGKVVIRTEKFKAHDIIGCDEGDRVEIMETRPLSRDKRWRVTKSSKRSSNDVCSPNFGSENSTSKPTLRFCAEWPLEKDLTEQKWFNNLHD